MPYCVNCGVELQDEVKKCPLCETPVILPECIVKQTTAENRIFPEDTMYRRKRSRRNLLELLSLVFFLPIPLLIFCNLNIRGEITWAGYAIGAIILLYVFFVVPLFPKRGNAVISIALDTLATLLYLYYIEYQSGGVWFFKFALPLVLIFALFSIILGLLSRYTKIAPLPLVSVGMLLCGLLCIVTEILLNLSFGVRDFLLWSLYPFLALSFFAIVLLYINKNENLKEKLRRKLLF